VSLDLNSPTVLKVSRAEQANGFGHDDRAEGLWDRVFAAGGVWEDLEPGDREFIDEMNRRVDAGATATLQNPEEWGTFEQWQAEDAELDEADAEKKSAESSADVDDEGDWIGV
jgi:hypothetical protein